MIRYRVRNAYIIALTTREAINRALEQLDKVKTMCDTFYEDYEEANEQYKNIKLEYPQNIQGKLYCFNYAALDMFYNGSRLTNYEIKIKDFKEEQKED